MLLYRTLICIHPFILVKILININNYIIIKIIYEDIRNAIYNFCDTPSMLTLNCVSKLFTNNTTKLILENSIPFQTLYGNSQLIPSFENIYDYKNYKVCIDTIKMLPFVCANITGHPVIMETINCTDGDYDNKLTIIIEELILYNPEKISILLMVENMRKTQISDSLKNII